MPAFDDLRTIAGQGTVGVEIVEQLGRAPDVVVVPVGGGGLARGRRDLAAAPRTRGVRVVGVEPAGAAAWRRRWHAGEPGGARRELDTFVDGAAVRRVGDVTFPLVRDAGARAASRSTRAGCAPRCSTLYQTDGIIAEPAGALATAAARRAARPRPGHRPSSVCSPAATTTSAATPRSSSARSCTEGLKHYFLVEFPQEPGALRRFLDEVLGPDDDIALFEYVKRDNRETGPALVGIEISERDAYEPLWSAWTRARCASSSWRPGTTAYRFLV